MRRCSCRRRTRCCRRPERWAVVSVGPCTSSLPSTTSAESSGCCCWRSSSSSSAPTTTKPSAPSPGSASGAFRKEGGWEKENARLKDLAFFSVLALRSRGGRNEKRKERKRKNSTFSSKSFFLSSSTLFSSSFFYNYKAPACAGDGNDKSSTKSILIKPSRAHPHFLPLLLPRLSRPRARSTRRARSFGGPRRTSRPRAARPRRRRRRCRSRWPPA